MTAGDEVFEEWPETMADLTATETAQTSVLVSGLSQTDRLPLRGADLIGHLVGGKYRIEGPLGEGGMAQIWNTRHIQLDKLFALKQIHPTLAAKPGLRERFYDEARLASALSHPNIVSIVDFGDDPAVGAYMVMEVIDGETLWKRLQRVERLPMHTACEIVVQVADALNYMHGRKIVHGDIKPENILINRKATSGGTRWHITLLDFGLARVGASKSAPLSEFIDGTPAYMAPERFRGEPLRPTADIYALGVMTFQLITGQLPFEGEPLALMYAHLNKAAPTMAATVNKEIDERLEALVARALSKDPAQRHASMEQFLYETRTLIHMLGGSPRGRRHRAAAGRDPGEVAHESLALLAFKQIAVAMAVLDRAGTVELANRAFTRFMTGDSDAQVAGQSVLSPRFIAIYPALIADLAEVAATVRPKVRRLVLSSDRWNREIEFIAKLEQLDESRNLLLTLTPQRGGR